LTIIIQNGLPFISASLNYLGKKLQFERVLLDTGSAGTVFSADKVLKIGIKAEPNDNIRELRGVGGTEFVFIKNVDRLSVGRFCINKFEI